MINAVRTLLLIIIPFLFWQAYAQHETSRWYFGNYAGLDFRNGSPVADLNNQVMDMEGGSACISDDKGNLLFFTDGRTIWNKEFNIMANGEGLAGNPNAAQSGMIIPWPGSKTLYCVFTLDRAPPAGDKGLNYSVIDMEMDGGKGAVTDKNINLMQHTSEQMTATRHSNGEDIWVIIHGWDTDIFYAYLVTASGVDPDPVESQTGLIQGGSGEGSLVGSMKVSPSGTKLALANYRKHMFEFFAFDPSSGLVSNPKQSFNGFFGAFAVEFSPDSRKVYGSTYSANQEFPQSYIFQFNAMSNNVGETGIPIPTSNDAPFRACAMQLGPDGRIYVSKYGDDHLGVIRFPNRDSAKCDYVENWISLAGRESRAGMPNFLQSYLQIAPFRQYGHCAGNDIYFQLINPWNIDSVVWDFNDKSSGAENISRLVEPSHVFSEPGTYSVRVMLYDDGSLYRSSWDVRVDPVPDIFLGDDRILYPGAYLILDAGNEHASYLWQDSSRQQTLFVDREGTYSVVVSNAYNCLNIDQVNVYYVPLTVPNAFTPDGDHINDTFGPVMPLEGISNYRMTVYDRWGSVVFEAAHPLQTWDGTHQGKKCMQGQYIWHIAFDAQKELTTTQRIEKQGSIVLLR